MGDATTAARDAALALLTDLERSWSTVVDVPHVLARARRVLAAHALRAADACQLAAALHACREQPHTMSFATLDERLAEAAHQEGFHVLTG